MVTVKITELSVGQPLTPSDPDPAPRLPGLLCWGVAGREPDTRSELEPSHLHKKPDLAMAEGPRVQETSRCRTGEFGHRGDKLPP